ncbi:hypothetical protein HUG17_2645 [Dermatophagoides farinae]|uniref:Fatty acyl-CoA reductase n=1 Tax=Dermatophagoides farinae TaxID=6954 RepID=A0A9D4NUY9_DERFA|nr:fatty acyl-CoA reductase 1-like [Dermatophagoides farinae]KAH7638612.1 hypothetical protein HUG17_2645 [Dermatophagoides farinae]
MTTISEFSVLEFYHDKTIFITGVTGFVGKVLLEKILRQCSCKRIYVLIRDKCFETSQKRLSNLLSTSPVFELHQDKIDKIFAINGDITANGLGISVEDRKKLINEVDVVFHSAATVNFDGITKKFIEQNIDGTDAILKLCSEMLNLKSIVYVSTAYCNCHLKEIEEKIYPIDTDQDFESYLNDLRINYGDISLKIGDEALKNRPNPYTLSKSIAEWMIEKRYSSLPIIICRPSIVNSSIKEPIPGWCDSTAGVAGSVLCNGLGISRLVIMDLNAKADIIPVDIVVNAMICSGAFRASNFYKDDKKVVNITLGDNSITWGKLVNETDRMKNVTPSMKTIRPVSVYVNPSRTLLDRLQLNLIMIFSHYLFAYLFDLICVIMMQKRFMVKLMDRVHKGIYLLKPFTCNGWLFHNHNIQYMNGLLPENERLLFNTNVNSIEWETYFYNFVLGCRRYLVNDPDSTLNMAKRRYNRIEIIYTISILIIHSLLYWLFKSMVLQTILWSSILILFFDFIFLLYIGYHLFQINGNIIDELQFMTKHFSKEN